MQSFSFVLRLILPSLTPFCDNSLDGQLHSDWGVRHPDPPRVRGYSNCPPPTVNHATEMRSERSSHLLRHGRLHLTNPRCHIKYREIISVISMEICFQIISPLPSPLPPAFICSGSPRPLHLVKPHYKGRTQSKVCLKNVERLNYTL